MPEAAHAGLVADRLGERLAERDADILDVWCASISRSPLASISRSIMPWRAT
jgi:hypothetical protein